MDHLSDSEWEELDELLDAALDRPPDEREAFLDQACDGRPELRRELEALMDLDEQAPSFFEGEAVSFAAPAYDPDDEDGIAEDPLATTSRRVGPYCLQEEIGRGGMSRVFRAERADGGFDQTVAVKLLRIGLDTPAARRRFRIEQQVLATLQHPNIAALLDGGLTEDDIPYLVMEYVDGRPITRYCDDNQLSIAERLQLLRDVGAALQHAHHNLVVHRDLKPSNVLVTDAGTVKLLDFGIAKLLADEGDMSVTLPTTRTGIRPMTPAFATPEQVMGQSVSTATDVYQMGVLAYVLLTGHRPYIADDRLDIEQAILERSPDRPSTVVKRSRPTADSTDDPPPATPEAISKARDTTPRQLCHTLEGDLDVVVQTALRKDPERRYTSVDAFCEDLRRYQEGQPVEARSDALSYRARKFVQRNRWGLGIATAFCALLVAFGAILVQQRNRAQQEALKAETVSSYLVDLFRAGSAAGVSDTVAARDLVRRGLNRVERLQNRPVIQAEMLDALGQASRGVGDWSRADSLLQRALQLRRRHLEAPHPDLVASLVHVADAKLNQQRHWEARPLYEEARTMSERLNEETYRAEVLEGIGQTMAVQGDPDSAEVLMRRAINLRRRAKGPQYHELPLDQMDLAQIVQQQGDDEEAESLYRAGLRHMERGTGYTPGERAKAYNNFGDLLRVKGEAAAAETYYRKALRLTTSTLGRDHPWGRRARSRLYESLIVQGKYQAALEVARTALQVAQAENSASSRSRAAAYQRIGHLLDNIGRSVEAESRLQKAVALWREEVGSDDVRTQNARLCYALCLVERGRLERAQAILREGESAYQQTHPDSTTVDLTRMEAILAVGKGRLRARQGQWAPAESLLTRGYNIRRRQVGLRAPLTQRALTHLVEVYSLSGRSGQAAAYRDSLLVR